MPDQSILESNIIKPTTTNGSLTLQGDSSGAGVTGLVIDSTGTVTTGTLGSGVVFPAGGTGNPISVAVICDEKAYNANGGNFATGDWRDRDLNTEISDPDGIVSIASNQFTLGTGTYLIEWYCPAFAVDRHFTRLYNVTTSSEISIGSISLSNSTYNGFSFSFGAVEVTITSANAFKIQHQSQSTNATGFGISTNDTDASSIYTIVKISKLK